MAAVESRIFKIVDDPVTGIWFDGPEGEMWFESFDAAMELIPAYVVEFVRSLGDDGADLDWRSYVTVEGRNGRSVDCWGVS